jgi:hypothetical protein
LTANFKNSKRSPCFPRLNKEIYAVIIPQF